MRMILALVSVLLLSCGEGLFDAAKRAYNGYPLAAVLVWDGSAKIVITDGGDYFRVVDMSILTTAPSVTLGVHMHHSGALFVADGSKVYVNMGSGGWSSTEPNPGMTILGLASSDNTVLALSGGKIFEFSPDGTQAWKETKDISSLMPLGLRNVDDGNDVYFIRDDGGIKFYRFGGGSEPVATVSGVTIPIQFFDRKDGVYYAGKPTMLGTSEGKFYMPSAGGTINDYAVLSSAEIYANGIDSTIPYIYKLNVSNSTFEPYYQISGSTATVLFGALEPDTLIVGLRDSIDNGIFIFDYAANSMRKIYSSAVYGLHVTHR